MATDDEDENSSEPEELFTVSYQAATYSGERKVWAIDGEQAIAKVKREIRSSMSLPMYYDSYTIVDRAGGRHGAK